MGANAQTSVPTFTAGDVLTAANMNISARTGVPVFADTTARDAGFGGTGEKVLAEGQLCYVENLTAANQIQYYNGTSWVSLQDRAVQIFQVSTTASQTISTSTYTDLTSLSLSITPTSASNKILLTYTTMGEKSNGNAANALNIRFLRDSTAIATWAYHMYTGTTLQMLAQGAWTYIDSPATTSAITYKIQGANQNNGAQVNVQSQGGPGQFIVMEIVA